MKVQFLLILCTFAFLIEASVNEPFSFLPIFGKKHDKAKDSKCISVSKGKFYPDFPFIFHGFNSNSTLITQIKFDPNTASYLFPPTNSNGTRCQSSWNKLWGTTRCGYLDMVHQDSDRFVWRRAQSCLIYNGSIVVGEKENCPDKNKIELAAYAYDNGTIPYQNIGTLLKEFKATVEVDTWYQYTMELQETQTIYTLAYENGTTIEVQTIAHRDCSNFNRGNYQSLYFGGVCQAPQDVTVCYST